MKWPILLRAAGLALFLTAGAASAAADVRVGSAQTVDPLAAALVGRFNEVSPELKAEVAVSGRFPTDAIAALLAGRVDVALVARELFASEHAAALRTGGGLRMYPVATGARSQRGGTHAIAIFVQAGNPLRRLTLPQLTEILAQDGRIRTWADLGVVGPLASRRITVHGMPVRRESGNPPGVVNFMEAAVLTGRAWRDDLVTHADQPGGPDSLEAIVRAVAADEAAIGYSGFDFAITGVRSLALGRNETGPFFSGEEAEIASRDYLLCRTIYACLRSDSPEAARRWVDFAQGPAGKEAIRRAGTAFFALPAVAGDQAVRATIDALPAYAPQGRVAGTVRLWGHGSHRRNFMGNLLARWVAEFARHQPGVRFENRMYGTASAIAALSVDAGEIALLGEEISPASAAEFIRAKGYAPTEIQVATGSLDVNFFDYAHMIFVHRDNPLAGLSLAQLEAVFGTGGKRGLAPIRTWGQLGLTGVWKERPITPYGWKVDEDFALFFRERVLGGSHHWNPAIREFVHGVQPDGSQHDHGQRILDALAADLGGIAISNVRYARPEVKALPLAWNSETPVAATPATLIAQAYPLVRIIPAFIDVPPGGAPEPAVREFLRYVLGREGQRALVEETGYLPLGAEVSRLQQAKLGEASAAATGQGSESPPGPAAFTVHTLPPARPLPSATKILRLAGPGALRPLAESWAAGLRAAHPEAKLELSFRGTDVGFAALSTGQADLVLAGREIAAQESKAFEWIFRYKPACVEVATGGAAAGCSPALVFYVHGDNPLTELSLAQADAAFGTERLRGAPTAIRTWGDLGLTGEWAAKPVHLYAPHMESGTGRFFREAVLGGSRKLRWEFLAEFNDTSSHENPTHDVSDHVLTALARDRFGLAVAAPEPGDRPVKALPLAIGSGSVPATADNIASRRYPLFRPVYAYFNRAPGETLDPLLAAFLHHVLGAAGQQAVSRDGRNQPLPASLRAEQSRLLD